MLYGIAYYYIAGMPLIVLIGLITLIFLFMTGTVVMLNKRGYHKIPMKWHFIFGKITVALGIIHGIFGIFVYML
ncbi:hypothetical protein [Methanoplanus endosymbiosus]|uniref:Uncharacterized protein n=1 Tax=Methanoplanus endosymbiosus TaxID=33865 RepID=A0A9E7TI59_9EURY|nr:hypothetical protein [Methanoplanus endosymbiosus]UUX91933.1 hypothetical protein L6E24_11275 [Methanoplanus endosymbiosus]